MRSRKKRIAVFLVIAFIMQLVYPCGNTDRAKVKAIDSRFSYENNLYKNQMSPYTIDLSEENTVATGGAIKIIKPNDFLWPGDYQYIKFNYEIKFKDETIKWEELKKNNLPEEAWYFHTVECTFAYCNVEGKWTNGTPLYSEWINKSEQLVPIVKKDLPSWVTEPCCFFVQIHNCDDGSWPLQVESVEIKSIQLIPYKNENTPVPTAEPVYDDPITIRPQIVDNAIVAGQDFSLDLTSCQTKFTNSYYDYEIDLSNVVKNPKYNADNYSEIRVHYKIDAEQLNELSNEYEDHKNYICRYITFDGPYGINVWLKRPCAKMTNEENQVNLVLKQPDVVSGSEIKIRAKNSRFGWPKEIKSITITGIDFIAKKNTVTPTATPTIKPTTATPQVKSTNLPTSTPAISIPQKVTNLKLKAGKKKQIKISWNNQKQADGYEVYRSTKKNKGYQKIAEGFKNNCSFTDSKVKYAKNYYYKVRAYYLNGKDYQYGVFSDVKKLMLRRKAPAFNLKRKVTTDGIHYISIRLKTCSDPYLQMWVRFGKKKYKKIPLSKHKIKKNTVLNFKYTPGKGKISFRIRSYRVQNKKRVYSKSKTKRI